MEAVMATAIKNIAAREERMKKHNSSTIKKFQAAFESIFEDEGKLAEEDQEPKTLLKNLPADNAICGASGSDDEDLK